MGTLGYASTAAGALLLLLVEPNIPLARAQSAPAADPVDRWSAHDPASPTAINYDPLDRVLAAFVAEHRGKTSVSFGRLKGDGERVIASMIAALQRVEVHRLRRDEQLAYWLNLRSAAVLHDTIKAFPVSRPQAAFQGPEAITAGHRLNVAGQALSVADIDRIVLTHWREPHVIYGLSLPVHDAPALPRAAFRGASVHQMLDALGRKFVNRAGVVQVKDGNAELSSFFLWHRSAFSDDATLLAHVRGLAASRLANRLTGTVTIGRRFDWRLAVTVERSFDALDLRQPERPTSAFGAGS